MQLAAQEEDGVGGKVRTKEEIKRFLNAVYGGKTKEGKYAFDPRWGVDFEVVLGGKDGGLERTKIMSEELLDMYANEFACHDGGEGERGGIAPSLNWYRTREINHRDELHLLEQDPPRVKIECPVLFIRATKDVALVEGLSRGMEKWVPRLRRREVVAGHWALWEKAEEVNAMIGGWLEEAVEQESRPLLGRDDGKIDRKGDEKSRL